MKTPLSFTKWLEHQDGGIEQSIADAESGADRELDYDSETSMEQAYEEYVQSFYK